VLLFDGTLDERIVVFAGTTSETSGTALEELNAPTVAEGVSVEFDAPPTSVADAWIHIDAELQARQLTSCGVYRQIVGPDGRTTLQAPIRRALWT